MNKEIWVSIKGYEGSYEVSSSGRIKSLSRYTICRWGKNQLRKERIISQYTDMDGYKRVLLHLDGIRTTFGVHRLVASAFIKNELSKPQVNHINGNPADNRAENLEWSTAKENINHSFKVLGKIANTTGAFGGNSRAAKKIKCNTLDIEFMSITEAADALGLKGANISMVLANIRKHTQGFVFRYI